jgi:hypothetical protein
MLIKLMEMPMNRRPGDKILDNSYNSGTVEFESYNNFAIDPIFKDTTDDYTKYHNYKLYEILNDIIENSKWKEYKTINKKISKFDISEYFEYMRSNFKETIYSEIEIFITMADIVNVNYKLFYDMIPNQYKTILLKELDKNYDIFKDIKSTKLF